jgi:hypothetical protein
MEFPNGNKTIALTPNMKFNPYIFCSRDTDKLKIKKISKPPIIVAFAWSMSLSSINFAGGPKIYYGLCSDSAKILLPDLMAIYH